ncbi:FtsB family cell division protein [Actinomyces ihuae]|uniref:FtsB family cell division protein n=2 Tax=Actinomycetaceae TaxID=2049 RepID=UPI00071C7438|nr:septum formation initiator family protein [Actinomyces ihuae]
MADSSHHDPRRPHAPRRRTSGASRPSSTPASQQRRSRPIRRSHGDQTDSHSDSQISTRPSLGAVNDRADESRESGAEASQDSPKGRFHSDRLRRIGLAGPRLKTGSSDSSRSASVASRFRRNRQPDAATKTKERSGGRGAKTARSDASSRNISFGGLTISVRFLAISIMAALLAVLLIPSAYQWFRQSQDLKDMQVRVEQARERNAELHEQLDLWKDPTYVASQARSRLGYVQPGETQYTVKDPGPGYEDASSQENDKRGPDKPWIQILAQSVIDADNPEEATHDAKDQTPLNFSQSGDEK